VNDGSSPMESPASEIESPVSGRAKVIDDSRTLVLLCTYNELANLPSLVETIRRTLPACDLLVIDDNSPDGTSDWVSEQSKLDPRLMLESRPGKHGLGSAIKLGIQRGIEAGYDWIVNLDADWSHDPAGISVLLDARMRSGTVSDMVIGSRYVPGGGMINCSWRRHLVSRCANLYTRWLLNISIHDCSSAFRCYRADFFKQIAMNEIKCAGYGFLEEILWLTLRNRGQVVEVPIVYTERSMGESKISIREAISTFTTINRLSIRRTRQN